MKETNTAASREQAGSMTSFFMARQPIFSKKLDLFGYELLFRSCSNDSCALIEDYDDATNKIIADGFAMALTGLGLDDKITVNVGYDNILSQYVLALPSDRVVLEVPADIRMDHAFLVACEGLKAQGYSFLLDNYKAQDTPGLSRMLAVAEYVKIPVSADGGRETARVKRSLSAWPGRTIATRVECWEEFEGCKFLGFDYFQGYFFSRPLAIEGRTLSSHKAVRLRILRELADDDAELARIVEVISMDQALSLRLLHYVNSAALRREQEVDTLARAASIVGLEALRKWTMTAVLADLDPGRKGLELSYRTLHGAFFLGLLAEKGLAGKQEPGTLFLLGLLHNIDGLLGLPMEDVLSGMPLKQALKSALLRERSEPLSGFVMVVDAVWRNDWSQAQSLFAKLGIAPNKAAGLFLRAGQTSGELLTSLRAA